MQLSELVRRIRRGEKEAVKELVAAYGSAVYQRAFERTGDKELAREAARQTFGQFVAIVQQQQEDDGWSLWFGDLIEKNISTYAQISMDMRTIESELDHEIVDSAPVPAAVKQPAAAEPDPFVWRAPEPAPASPRKAEPEPLAWRNEPDTAPTREPEKQKNAARGRKADERGRKADERDQKTEERVHKDSIRDEIFDEPYRKKNTGSTGHGFSIFLLILISLLLLWVVVGVAMTMRWIPFSDLGYTWFNLHVFKLY